VLTNTPLADAGAAPSDRRTADSPPRFDLNRRRIEGVTTLIAVTIALFGCTQGSTNSSDATGATTPTPTSRVLTVSKAIQLRDAGELGSGQITLSGF